MQTNGRPGQPPLTINTNPFPAMGAKDNHGGQHGDKHHDLAHAKDGQHQHHQVAQAHDHHNAARNSPLH